MKRICFNFWESLISNDVYGNHIHGILMMVMVFLMNLNGHSQTVTEVIATQEGQSIKVMYTLSGNAACDVQLYLSEDGGITWKEITSGLSGDVKNQSSGSHAILWDVLQTREQLVGSEVVFKVNVLLKNENFKTVEIGNQVWMAENLKVTTFRNGESIKEIQGSYDWADTYQPAWCYYSNKEKFADFHGVLYNWYVVNDSREICPEGFHVPNEMEWNELIQFIQKGNKGFSDGYNTISFFNKKLGGLRNELGEFGYNKIFAFYWIKEGESLYVKMGSNSSIQKIGDFKQCGASIRCLSDNKLK